MNFGLINFLLFIPIFSAFVSFSIKRIAKYIYLGSSFITSAICFFSIYKFKFIKFTEQIFYYTFGNWSRDMGIEFVISYDTLIVLFSIAFLNLINSIANFNKIKKNAIGFLLIISSSLAGLTMTNDIFNLYVFIELTAISLYGIYTIFINRFGLKLVFDYMVLNTICSLFVLLGIFIIYNYTGTLNLSILLNNVDKFNGILFYSGFFFLAIAMLFKSGMYPFHTIHLSLYKQIPNNISQIISNLNSKIYLFKILKLSSIFLFAFLNNPFNIKNDIYFWYITLNSIFLIMICFKIFQRNFGETFLFLFGISQINLNLLMIVYSNLPYVKLSFAFSILFNGMASSILFNIISDIKSKMNINTTDEKAFLDSISFLRLYKFFTIFSLLVLSGMPISALFIFKWLSIFSIVENNSIIFFIPIILYSLLILLVCGRFLMNVTSNQISTEIEKELKDKRLTHDLKIIISSIFVLMIVIFSFLFFRFQ